MNILLAFLLADAVLILGVAGVYLIVTRPRWRQRMLADHLAVLTRKNLPLQPFLPAMASDFGGLIGRAFHEIQDRLLDGQRLSDAVTACGRHFGPMLRHAIVLGERSGNLAGFLEQASRSIDESERVRSRYELLFVYPILVTIVTGQCIVSFSYFIVPQFEKVFYDIGVAMPAFTGLLREVSPVAALVGAPVLLLFIILQFKIFRPLGDRLLLLLPVARRIQLDASMEQVALALGLYLRAGATLPEAVRAAADLDVNVLVKKRLRAMADHVEQGGSVGSFLKEERLLTREFAWMVEVGGAAGNLHEQLLRAAELHRGRARTTGYFAARIFIASFVLFNGLMLLAIAHSIFSVLSGLIGGIGP